MKKNDPSRNCKNKREKYIFCGKKLGRKGTKEFTSIFSWFIKYICEDCYQNKKNGKQRQEENR